MSFFSGKNASFKIGAQAQPMSQCDVDIKGDAVDTTNFTSGGKKENVFGIEGIDLSGSGPWNGSAGIVVGTLGSLAIDMGNAVVINVPARCTNVKLSTDVKGATQAALTFESCGIYAITY